MRKHTCVTDTGRGGYVLLLVLVTIALCTTIATSLVSYTIQSARAEHIMAASAQALTIAEGGVDLATYELNADGSYTGASALALGDGELDISVTTINSNTKEITATAYVPDSTNLLATRSVKAQLNINTSVVSFQYGAQVGTGGVSMNNGSVIEGSIYSNGSISGSGLITGDAIVAGGANPLVDQSWSTQNGGFTLGDTSARADVAMSFLSSTSTVLRSIKLYLKKTGLPGDLTIKVVTDSSGSPSKSVVASGTLLSSQVTDSYSWATVNLSSQPNLNVNQTYWVIAIASVNSSNYFTWGADTFNGYAYGTGKYSTNWNASHPVWNATGSDLDFEIYTGGSITSLSGVHVQGNASANTLSSCTIDADAYYQSISGCTVGGTSYPGSDDPPQVALPISDAQIADWETIAASGGTIAGPYSISGGTHVTLGPKKINGNLTLSNGAILTLTGPIWVNGDISLSNNAQLDVDASAGQNGAIIIAHNASNPSGSGRVTLSNNVIVTGNGSTGSFPMIISMNTGSNAVSLSNNADSVILYAPYGRIIVSNGASANQLTANELYLSNNATVEYLSGLQNASFTNGPGGSWTYVPGTYRITQ